MVAHDAASLPVAADCRSLAGSVAFALEEDTFEQDNGFGVVDTEYIEEGSPDIDRPHVARF